MAQRKRKKTNSVVKKKLLVLFLFVIFLAFLTLEPRKVEPLTLPKNLYLEVATNSSLFTPKAEADNNQEDYCITVPVLLYHHIQPLYLSYEKNQEALTVGVEYFDMHMHHLWINNYTSLSADTLVNAILHRKKLPPKSIVVTFDDGYEDNYLYAFPILKKYNIIGNFMIAPGLIGKKDYMTWDQLKELARSPLVRLYNHTTHHTDVGRAPKEISEKEITIAQQILAKETGFNYPIFTYPYGSTSDTAIAVLRQLGFRGAFTTEHGFTQCRSHILKLHRNHVGNLPLSAFGL